jgi:hypothetical protein
MGRGGFPPSETGSFSAHHTAQWVGLFLAVSYQSSGISERFTFSRTLELIGSVTATLPARLF